MHSGINAGSLHSGEEANRVRSGEEASRLRSGNEASRLRSGNEASDLRSGEEASRAHGNYASRGYGTACSRHIQPGPSMNQWWSNWYTSNQAQSVVPYGIQGYMPYPGLFQGNQWGQPQYAPLWVCLLGCLNHRLALQVLTPVGRLSLRDQGPPSPASGLIPRHHHHLLQKMRTPFVSEEERLWH